MLTNVKIRLLKNGIRRVTCHVDGHPVEPFDVYPDAYQMFGGLTSKFFGYIERQARGLLHQFGDAYGRRVA